MAKELRCYVRSAAKAKSTRTAHQWTQERANPVISGFPSPCQSGGQKGCLRRLHFMRPFAPCFGKLVASPRVYLLNWQDRTAITKSGREWFCESRSTGLTRDFHRRGQGPQQQDSSGDQTIPRIPYLITRWKWPFITHWHDFLNRNQPTDSAEEAINDTFQNRDCDKVLVQSPSWL